MPIRRQWVQLVFFAVLLFLLLALASYAYLGTFTRYMADDYCTASTVKNANFWEAQAYWWNNWSGRYSFTFVILLAELIGLQLVPILPGLIITLWVCSISWVCTAILKKLNVPNHMAGGLFLASLTLWMTYRSVDDYPQIVFWQTGILTYPITPILIFLAMGIVIRQMPNPFQLRWWELILWFLFAFFAGGFSETGVVMQISIIMLLLIGVWIANSTKKRSLTALLLVTLLGSVLSLVTIAVAPGNLIRSNGFRDVPLLSTSFPGLLRNALLFVPNLIDQRTFPMVFGFVAGVFFVYFYLPEDLKPRNMTIARHFLVALSIAEVGVLTGIGPAYMMNGVMPQERILLFTYFLVACLIVYGGMLCALLVRSNLSSTTHLFQRLVSLGLLVVLIAWGGISAVASNLQLIPSLQSYSSLWDERHQELLAAAGRGEQVLVARDFTKVEALRGLRTKLWVSGDFENASNYWINRCAADYYDVDQVIAK